MLNYNLVSHNYQDLHTEVDLKPNLIIGFSLYPQLQSPHYPRQSISQASIDSTNSYLKWFQVFGDKIALLLD